MIISMITKGKEKCNHNENINKSKMKYEMERKGGGETQPQKAMLGTLPPIN